LQSLGGIAPAASAAAHPRQKACFGSFIN